MLAFAWVELRDHVYFVHPSTDTQPLYRSTYRLSIGQYVNRDIGRELVDMSTEMCRPTYRMTHRSICRPTLD